MTSYLRRLSYTRYVFVFIDPTMVAPEPHAHRICAGCAPCVCQRWPCPITNHYCCIPSLAWSSSVRDEQVLEKPWETGFFFAARIQIQAAAPPTRAHFGALLLSAHLTAKLPYVNCHTWYALYPPRTPPMVSGYIWQMDKLVLSNVAFIFCSAIHASLEYFAINVNNLNSTFHSPRPEDSVEKIGLLGVGFLPGANEMQKSIWNTRAVWIAVQMIVWTLVQFHLFVNKQVVQSCEGRIEKRPSHLHATKHFKPAGKLIVIDLWAE